MVTSSVALFAPEEDFVATAITINLIGALTAMAGWHGVLFGKRASQPETVSEWLGIFFGGSLMSTLFLLVDCHWHLPIALGGSGCDSRPNFSVIFTIGAIAMTVIALPSALRAWLIARMSPTFEERP